MTVDATTEPLRGDAASLLVGGRYRLVERLGGGGAADVWRAADERLRREVAVKLFRPGATDAERERREMQLMARLSHPGLVTVYDAGEQATSAGPARTFLVLELVDGATLREHFASRSIPSAELAAIGASVADSLGYIHALGVVHRDVKPANILIPAGAGTTDTRAKLADFGVAHMLDNARLTEAGHVVGTANYVSPEQIRGADIGPASDVYSLALVLLEGLTGHLEYPGSGVCAAIDRLHRPPAIPPGLGAEWATLLTAMVRDDPTTRPSATEVAARLAAVADDSPAPPAAAAPVTVRIPAAAAASAPAAAPAGPAPAIAAALPRRRHRARWGLLVATVAVAALGAIVLAVVTNSIGGDHAPRQPAQPAVTTSSTSGTPSTDSVASSAGAGTTPPAVGPAEPVPSGSATSGRHARHGHQPRVAARSTHPGPSTQPKPKPSKPSKSPKPSKPTKSPKSPTGPTGPTPTGQHGPVPQ